MIHSLPLDPDLTSETLQVNGRLGETIGAYAAEQRVVVEIDDGVEMVNIHLTPDTAERHIANVRASIALSRVMRSA